MKILQAFHNDPTIKQKYITQIENHYELDEIIKGEVFKKDQDQKEEDKNKNKFKSRSK